MVPTCHEFSYSLRPMTYMLRAYNVNSTLILYKILSVFIRVWANFLPKNSNYLRQLSYDNMIYAILLAIYIYIYIYILMIRIHALFPISLFMECTTYLTYTYQNFTINLIFFKNTIISHFNWQPIFLTVVETYKNQLPYIYIYIWSIIMARARVKL